MNNPYRLCWWTWGILSNNSVCISYVVHVYIINNIIVNISDNYYNCCETILFVCALESLMLLITREEVNSINLTWSQALQ